MVDQPETRYAHGPQGDVAYQVVGDGPIDLVVVPGWISHIDMQWGFPGWRTYVEQLASFARLVLYDKRGTGLSDPVDGVPTLESRVDDLAAVMNAAGSQRAALFGFSEGGPISLLFAATYPERVDALILYGTFASASLDDANSPGWAQAMRSMTNVKTTIGHWGEGTTIDWAAPSIRHDTQARRARGAFERAAMSPRMALLAWQAGSGQVDVRDILGSVRVPTLVLHRNGEAVPVEYARELASKIPGARLVEIDGVDHLPWVGDISPITGEVEEFLTGQRHEHPSDRMLATVLFSDIVDSTRRAAALGDRQWRALLDRHDEITRAEISSFQGRVVKHTGDGVLAAFDGPTRALRCAKALTERLSQIDINVRIGLHTGECERRGDDIGGIAVHIGARIAACASAGEVLVSSTVKDLVYGSGITFKDCGAYELKGVPGQWRLFALAGQHDAVQAVLTANEWI